MSHPPRTPPPHIVLIDASGIATVIRHVWAVRDPERVTHVFGLRQPTTVRPTYAQELQQ